MRIYNIQKNTTTINGNHLQTQTTTSFRNSVVFGSRLSDTTTIPNLIEELRYSNGCIGSFSLNAAYSKDNTNIPTGWYNYLYVPHRSGGLNGAAQGDNCNYGTLILWSMTLDSGMYVVRFSTGDIQKLRKVWDTTNMTYSLSGTTLTITTS